MLRECYGDRLAESVDSSSPAVMRLRRLVASRTSIEAAEVLQPILALIRSKRPGKLHYARLMVQLSIFDLDPNQVKAEWVHDFYIPEEKRNELGRKTLFELRSSGSVENNRSLFYTSCYSRAI